MKLFQSKNFHFLFIAYQLASHLDKKLSIDLRTLPPLKMVLAAEVLAAIIGGARHWWAGWEGAQ